MVPKTGTREGVLELCDRLSWHEGRSGVARGATKLILLLETAAGIHDGNALAQISPQVQASAGKGDLGYVIFRTALTAGPGDENQIPEPASLALMLTALGSDFVRTARASGLSGYAVVMTYAFRNALLSIATIMGMIFSFLLGSNVLIEQVFGWPGIGNYAVSAVIASDYAAVQGFILMMAVLYVLLNLLVDIVSGAVDPRVQFEG